LKYSGWKIEQWVPIFIRDIAKVALWKCPIDLEQSPIMDRRKVLGHSDDAED